MHEEPAVNLPIKSIQDVNLDKHLGGKQRVQGAVENASDSTNYNSSEKVEWTYKDLSNTHLNSFA